MYNGFMDVKDEKVKAFFSAIMAQYGKLGGIKCNPLKGFGTGDNARKAAAVRWEKYRKGK